MTTNNFPQHIPKCGVCKMAIVGNTIRVRNDGDYPIALQAPNCFYCIRCALILCFKRAKAHA
jgi:hypothetical protein